MNNELIIRADSSLKIGTGHIMRCLALAEEWKNRGGRVIFVGHLDSDFLKGTIENRGFQHMAIKVPGGSKQDRIKTVKTLERINAAAKRDGLVVIDGYQFGHDYQAGLRKHCPRTMVICDYPEQGAFSSDYLLNQNINARPDAYTYEKDTELLFGPRYALIRPEFIRWRRHDKSIPAKAKNILITMGGADPWNATITFLDILEKIGEQDLDIKTIVGHACPHRPAIQEMVARSRMNIQICQSVTNMPELMTWSDLAITAGGSTCLELALLGIPFAAVVVADNQALPAAGVSKRKIGINLGLLSALEGKIVADQIGALIYDGGKRAQFSANGKKTVDGFGARRVLEKAVPTRLTMRTVREADSKSIWQWANDPVTRKVSFSEKSIPWDEHRIWFGKKQVDRDCIWLMAENQFGEKMGVARFEKNNADAIISVNVKPGFRGVGLGSRLIKTATAAYIEKGHAEKTIALIKPDNRSSVKAFQTAGYIQEKTTVHSQQKALRFFCTGEGNY